MGAPGDTSSEQAPPEPTWVMSYGTLMSEKVLEAVLGRVPSWTPGTVTGYARVCLGNGRCYPGVLPRNGATVTGRVLRDVTASELARLDRFEGDEYHAIVQDVVLQDGTKVMARMWALADMDGVIDQEWNFDKFLAENEHWYVDMCRSWAADDEKEEQKCTAQRRGSS